jgi:hypothetical protein
VKIVSYNPYLDDFLMFYSQSDAGNGLTRGLETELARHTYVPTKLDSDLAPAILEGRFRLVILTGNAGDGKTAFIQMLEKHASEQGTTVERSDSLGSRFIIAGLQYRTLYDGSVDSEVASNFEMLSEFFSPIEGDSSPSGNFCLIAAMNEGKLRDFLSNSFKHGWLSRILLNHFRKNEPLPGDMVLVNLNLRSVVDAASELGQCLFDQILDRYVANEFWMACNDCAAREKCPVKFNVDTFRYFPTNGLPERDAVATNERNEAARKARVRLKAILQILHFRKRIHVTVRDLRSVLAFVLFGKRTCAQIEARIKSGETDFLDWYYYNAIFHEKERDRILEFLREFDVGMGAAPQIDSLLSFTRPRTREFRQLFYDFSNTQISSRGRTRIDEEELHHLYNQRPQSPDERTLAALAAARRYVMSLRRKLFFEGDHLAITGSNDPIWVELVPYDNLTEFMAFMAKGQDPGGTLKYKIVEGISRSEGIHDAKRGKENVCIRTRQDLTAKVKAFFTYPATDFSLTSTVAGSQAAYIEYLPTSIVFRHEPRKIELEISLDLYEMLIRIREGYLPTAGEMLTFFLNLLMFKKQLMSLPSAELLLTETDYQIFKLTRTPKNDVAMTAL